MSYITESRMPTDRRPSMAERRNSTTVPERRPSVIIPSLAGIEKPESEQEVPEEVDVVIVGTGIVESILAAALQWQGSQVLHIDNNMYYGDTSSTLTIDQLKNWADNVNKQSPGFKNYSNALLYIPRPRELVSKDYGIDINPRILFAKSDLLTLLINSRVYKYLEFLPLSTYHTYENDSFEKIASTKEDIFTDQSLSLTTKRYLMKFMKFVFTYDESDESKNQWINYKDKPFKQFIEENYKLALPQLNEIIFSIALSSTPNISTIEGLSRVKRYLTSFEVYGEFPAMYSKYGGPGEISQGFCRSAAVAGATYKLNTKLSSYDSSTKIAKFSDNTTIKVNEKIICSPSQAPIDAQNVPKQTHEITRLIAVVKNSCKEWMNNKENSCLVIFPTGSLPTSNEYPVQVLIQGEGAGVCPHGQSIWYLSSVEKSDRARQDLEAALLKLEESLLRESEEDGLDTILTEEDIIVSNNQQIVVNSVKLGKSFKDFVPKQKVQYLFKLLFSQSTSIPPFGVVDPKLFDHDDNDKKATNTTSGSDEGNNNDAPDAGVIYSNMPSSEISYDGIITEAKLLYSKIVGDDEDFFQVDFEDDEEFEQAQQLAVQAVTMENERSRRNSSLSPYLRHTNSGSATVAGIRQTLYSPTHRPSSTTINSSGVHSGNDETAIVDGDDIEMDFDL